jgi:hypothetical protein
MIATVHCHSCAGEPLKAKRCTACDGTGAVAVFLSPKGEPILCASCGGKGPCGACRSTGYAGLVAQLIDRMKK